MIESSINEGEKIDMDLLASYEFKYYNDSEISINGKDGLDKSKFRDNQKGIDIKITLLTPFGCCYPCKE